MHHAFISYSRRDAGYVERVVEELERMGHEVWIDRRDIPVSFPWLADVREAIAAADVFVEFRSPRQAASQACALESAAAAELGKETLAVAVGEQDAALAARSIASGRVAGEGDRTELLVRARTWDRHGRPRTALPGRRPWRRLRNAANAGPRQLPAVTAAFLRAARRRNRRRRVFALLGLTVIAISIGTISTLSKVKDKETRELDRTELLFSDALFARLEAEADVYGALRRSAERVEGRSDGFIATEALQHAMNIRVPDFSRRLPAGESSHGLEPQDGAAARALSADGELEAVGRRVDGRVDVRHPGGELVARLWTSGPTTALAFSPDGRLLAAAEGQKVGVYTVQSEVRMGWLGGGRGGVRALRWSADGSRIWALSGHSRISAWPWRAARILLDRPDLEFVKLGTEQDGRLVGVDVRGRLAILAPGGPARVVATSAREVRGAAFFGSEVALASETGVVVHDLKSGRERSWRPADCLVTDVAYSRDGRKLFVGCADTSIRVFEARTARPLGSSPISNGPMRLASLPGGELLVGSARGQGVLVHADGTTEVVAEGAPGGAMFAVAASQSGARALLGGLGGGGPFTLFTGAREGDGWRWDSLLAEGGRFRAVAGAFSSDDRQMALGFESGKVLVRGLGAEVGAGPDWSDLPGSAKGLAFAGGHLFVATSAGLIAVYDEPCPHCESPQGLAAAALRRYRFARRTGLAEHP